MIIVDTSFLFSLFGTDAHTAAAQNWAQLARQPIAITALNRYEFANAVRFAAFRKDILQKDALSSLRAFDEDLKQGMLQLTPCDFGAVLIEADRLSERHTVADGHRSFDILHVATARVLKAKTFLTFDINQRKLANAVHLVVGP